MARTAKLLAQGALSSTITAQYTTPASTTAQVTEIYLANTGTTARTINIYAGGTYSTNSVIVGLSVNGTASVLIQDTKIVLATTKVLAAKQDTGTDIIMTIFGVEEV
jgi:hypothetical protein